MFCQCIIIIIIIIIEEMPISTFKEWEQIEWKIRLKEQPLPCQQCITNAAA